MRSRSLRTTPCEQTLACDAGHGRGRQREGWQAQQERRRGGVSAAYDAIRRHAHMQADQKPFFERNHLLGVGRAGRQPLERSLGLHSSLLAPEGAQDATSTRAHEGTRGAGALAPVKPIGIASVVKQLLLRLTLAPAWMTDYIYELHPLSPPPLALAAPPSGPSEPHG